MAAQIIILPREKSEWHVPPPHPLISELYSALEQSKVLSGKDKTGWIIQVSPVHLQFSYINPEMETRIEMPGYGCGLLIEADASSRSQAAQRWGRACDFIADTLHALQHQPGQAPADPYVHLQNRDHL